MFSYEWKEHLKHLDAVLTAYEEAGMTLKLRKCQFAKPQIKYLGHYIGNGEMHRDEVKVEAIANMTMPLTKKLLKSFIALCNYYRSYVPQFASIALPLTELTKSKVPNILKPTEIELQTFDKLKTALCSKQLLYSPRYDRPFIVQTDASDYAVGACLSQNDDENNERPIAFASAKLTDTQKRWSTVEKEAYAIIFALHKFDHIVFGSQIILYTDHNPLQYIVACTPRSAKLTRWSLALQRFNITIKFRAGKENANCDALSRL